MPTYTLELVIDSADLRVIRAAQERVILAKPTAAASPNVAWVAFDPFEDNGVEWTEEYSIYASYSTVQSGATIRKSSETRPKADPAKYYVFDSGATFQGPFVGDVPANSYQVQNEMPATSYPELTFGLAQKASINGRESGASPVNAVSVPAKRSVTFTPLTVVRVWLQANILSGTVFTEITSNYTEVVFGGSVNKISLKYSAATGTFEMVPSAKGALVGASVTVVRPADRLFA